MRISTERDGSAATGSGFFIDKDGTVATDYHVIRDAKSIQLTTSDGRSFPAKLDKHRSTADRINAAINVGSDLMMMSGPALRYIPRLKPIAGSVQAAGAGIRMTNDWLAGRRFD